MSAKTIGVALAAGVGVLSVLYLGWLWGVGALGYQPLEVAASSDGVGREMYAWRGAVHVHTTLSGDARGTADEVVAAAASAGLDFVVISEHTLARGATGRTKPGWYGNVLVVVAEEVSTSAGHLLALGVPPHEYALGPTARQAAEDIAELGGRAIIAHPDGGELAWQGRWPGASGVEVVSYSDALQGAGWQRRLAAALIYPVSWQAAALRIFEQRPAALEAWDQNTRLEENAAPRRLAAVGAVDAHGPVRWLGVPTYGAAFESLSMLVWLSEPPSPGRGRRRVGAQIAAALATGNSAIVLRAAGVEPRFEFTAHDADTDGLRPGEVAPWHRGWRLRATVGAPGDYQIVALRDGKPVAASDGEELLFDATEPGTYRVEVFRTQGPPGGGRAGATPWVISNPIYLWTPEAIAASRRHGVPALPAPDNDDDLMRASGWAAESDPTSMSAMALGETGMLWDMRIPAGERTSAYAAIAWRPQQPVDWSSARGVGLHLRAERTWRVGLRVWTLDARGGQRTWERVVPANQHGRGTGVLWRQFRLLEGSGLGSSSAAISEDLSRVVGLALVATPVRMKPQTETRIEILQLGTFGSAWP